MAHNQWLNHLKKTYGTERATIQIKALRDLRKRLRDQIMPRFDPKVNRAAYRRLVEVMRKDYIDKVIMAVKPTEKGYTAKAQTKVEQVKKWALSFLRNVDNQIVLFNRPLGTALLPLAVNAVAATVLMTMGVPMWVYAPALLCAGALSLGSSVYQLGKGRLRGKNESFIIEEGIMDALKSILEKLGITDVQRFFNTVRQKAKQDGII